MARTTFVFDDDFDENVYKASSKSNSSLRPLYDTVRRVTDEIYFSARDSISQEAGVAEGNLNAIKNERFKPGAGDLYNFYKAKAFALMSARNSTYPSMGYDGKEIFGRVAIGRKYSYSLEYGGLDFTAEIGKDTGQYVNHPAYAFLRRAMDMVGR